MSDQLRPVPRQPKALLCHTCSRSRLTSKRWTWWNLQKRQQCYCVIWQHKHRHTIPIFKSHIKETCRETFDSSSCNHGPWLQKTTKKTRLSNVWVPWSICTWTFDPTTFKQHLSWLPLDIQKVLLSHDITSISTSPRSFLSHLVQERLIHLEDDISLLQHFDRRFSDLHATVPEIQRHGIWQYASLPPKKTSHLV